MTQKNERLHREGMGLLGSGRCGGQVRRKRWPVCRGRNHSEGVEVIQITENGLALQATLQGTKYWRDRDLNYTE